MEVTKYLLGIEGVKFVLSVRFNQDPVEDYFGKQRAHGGRCENPTAQQFLTNSMSLRLQGSAALAPIRGNCRRRQPTEKLSVDETPLAKRPRRSKNNSF